MASSTGSGFVVLTQSDLTAPAPVSCSNPHTSSVLGKFLKVEPKALGTVQIMIGVVQILLGIILSVPVDNFGLHIGIFFWGSLIYISSGALSVSASKKLNKCLVRAALGMNVISTITAGIAMIAFSLDCYFICYGAGSSAQRHCTIRMGVFGVLLVFSILEFIISICVSVFACRTAGDCCSSEPVVYIAPVNSQVMSGNLPISTPEMAALGQGAMASSGQTEKPPEYEVLS